MEFPMELKISLEENASGLKMAQMKKIAEQLSLRYREESGQGRRLVTNEAEAIVYSIVRMPATFGAVADALGYALECCDGEITSLLDIGAGTGAASFACDAKLALSKVTCLEREDAMISVGKKLMREGSEALRKAQWIKQDLFGKSSLPHADLVVSSYMLNEMAEAEREQLVSRLYEAADRMLLIVEPGTPVGFAQLKNTRAQLLARGAHIAAPCPMEEECRLNEDDWCHFTCRVQRSKLHRELKEADVPYEDEKYAYMAFVKEEPEHVQARILRHPYIEKGKITLQVCTAEDNKSVEIKKKDGALFKTARKSQMGDGIEIE